METSLDMSLSLTDDDAGGAVPAAPALPRTDGASTGPNAVLVYEQSDDDTYTTPIAMTPTQEVLTQAAAVTLNMERVLAQRGSRPSTPRGKARGPARRGRRARRARRASVLAKVKASAKASPRAGTSATCVTKGDM